MQFSTNAQRVIHAVNVMRGRYSRHITIVDVFPLLLGMTFDEIEETIDEDPRLEADINGIITRCPEQDV